MTWVFSVEELFGYTAIVPIGIGLNQLITHTLGLLLKPSI